MSLILRITLPFGRYHATPWGHHVNEGQIEWPPSPWRVARALVSAWHTRVSDLEEPAVTHALGALCSTPEYLLPRWSRSHTRHWMPGGGGDKVSLALDPFVATDLGASALAIWDTQVDDEARRVLDRLAAAVPYLGRAESVAQLTFLDSLPTVEGLQRWVADEPSTLDQEVLRLLVPERPLSLDALHVRSAQLQRGGRTIPPSTHWATYSVAQAASPDRVVHRPSVPRPRVVSLAVTGRARPLLRDAVLLGGQLRALVTSHCPDEPALHGHTDAGKRLDQHQHAHYLSVNDLGTSLRVDRLLVWVPEGMPAAAAARIASLTDLRFDLGDGYLAKRLGTDRLRLGVELVGGIEHLDPAILGPSHRWRTLTPMTTTRHRKPNRESPSEFFEGVVRRGLGYRGLPSSPSEVAVQVSDGEGHPANLNARRFHRSRQWGQTRGREQPACHVHLEFRDPITGPLVLGSLGHFGLGLFRTDE